MGHHAPYEITQCYLSVDTGERAPPYSSQAGHTRDLPTPEGWKAELTYKWLVTYQDGLPVSRESPIQVLTRPGVD